MSKQDRRAPEYNELSRLSPYLIGHYARIFVLLAQLLLVVYAKPVSATPIPKHPKVILVLRYDDYSWKSPIAVERQIIEMLKKNHAKAVFAVIPFACDIDAQKLVPQKNLPLTPEKIKLLKEGIRAGVIEVALHGYSHQTIRTRAQGYSEFAGERYEVQLRKIRVGKRYLETVLGVPITSFVPPWNHYDQNTCRALSAAGISVLSGDLKGPQVKSQVLIPCTINLTNLYQTVERAAKVQGSGHMVQSQFHHYDFNARSADSRATMPFPMFVRLIRRESTRDNVEIKTFTDLAGMDFSAERYRANHRPNTMTMLLPKALRNSDSKFIYLTESEVTRRDRRIVTMMVVFYGLVILIAWTIGLLAARFVRVRPRQAKLIMTIIALAGVGYLVGRAEFFWPDYATTTKAAFAVACFVGLLAGKPRFCRQET